MINSIDADVIVVGLGAMGSQTLWRLAERGVDVIGIEQFTPGHDHGASHGESRIIRSAYAEGASYVPLVKEAWQLWRDLEHASGRALLEQTGALMLGPADSPVIVGPLASARAWDLKYKVLDTEELRGAFPQYAPLDGLMGFYEEDAGYLRPEASVTAAVEVARARGAEVLQDTAVTGILPDPGRPRVRIGDRELTARHVVVAVGGWLRRLLPATAPLMTVERRVMGWFRPTDPAAFGADRFPVFVHSDASGDHNLYGFPSLDGETLKIGLHTWPGIYETIDPAAGHRPPDAADAQRFAEAVHRTFVGVDPQPVRMESCMYSLTPDRHFLVGPRRDLPGLTLLGGFSGHGFKFASVIGEIAAQFAVTGKTGLPVDKFDPHRFDS
ncbi:N-methyl-L-tryptophan oxidase [Streptomyces sp. NBC_00503]|uniref:N-methyl-L-tryptophan oxidase n=1 Tax=Streptomyces sp. NBC_00503 TaxID=2903659 RepID=UPI002E822BF8|nr:N-methyl-L-tryptophan oxidase [Streptomyces sp. NBC_00503]WUD83481.1 N-methyl-L-tryptophan oxidase [Streptomyces sp. NBC_00503]